MSLGTILIILLVLALIGVLPTWGYSTSWGYAPGGVNKMMGMKFDGYSKTFTERGPHRIGTVYR